MFGIDVTNVLHCLALKCMVISRGKENDEKKLNSTGLILTSMLPIFLNVLN
jgi:hypothetical protein